MELRVLSILDSDPDIVRLVATWHIAGHAAEVLIEDRTIKMSADDLEFWASISGVDQEDVERLLPRLFFTGICAADGAVDEDAAAYLEATVASKLPKSRTGS